jgi:Cd2+/Zn2+-exporting ATPase
MSSCTTCERHTESTFRIEGLCCHTEAATLERRLLRVGGIHRLSTDVVSQRLRVAYDAAKTTTATIAEAVAETGMRAWLDPDHQRAAPRDDRAASPHDQAVPPGGRAASRDSQTASLDDGPASADDQYARTFAASAVAPASHVGARGRGRVASFGSRAAWHVASLAIAATALGLGLVLHAIGAAAMLTMGLMVVAVIAGGVTTVRRAVAAVRNRTLDMYVLMLVAVVGAGLIGEWFEAATVVVLFSFAQVLERRSLDRARRAIGALVGVAATDVRLRRSSGDVQVPLDQVRVGDLMLLAPGERIALDGVIAGGASDVNQAPVTGESVPVAKEPGDRLFAGTINGHGALEVRVTAVGDDTTIARIIHLVERAQEQRAPSQAWVDRFAHRYTPIVLTLATLVAIVPPLLFAQPFAWWLYRALVLLVIACPCALVLSTPISIVSGLAAAARRGVLIKGGVFLEKLATLRTLALDKTGTLTRGILTVHDVIATDGHTADDVIATAAALGTRSEHPLARAISAYAAAHHIAPPRATALRALPGQGMSGRLEPAGVANRASVACATASSAAAEDPPPTLSLRGASVAAPPGSLAVGAAAAVASEMLPGGLAAAAADAAASDALPASLCVVGVCGATLDAARDGLDVATAEVPAVEVLIGNRRLFEQREIGLDGLEAWVGEVAARGMTVVLVARGGRAIGAVGLLDEMRTHSREAIEMLRAEGIRHVALLTGDHEVSARAAGEVGRVDTVEAGLLPADKVAAVERLRRRYGAIAMVGDGINDAPALAAADIGVAMGVAGTDAAIETADVALMADDLRALSYVVRLGRKTLRTVKANVAIALGLKLAFMVMALAGVATLWMAVVADMGASLIVVANALRLLRTR